MSLYYFAMRTQAFHPLQTNTLNQSNTGYSSLCRSWDQSIILNSYNFVASPVLVA